MSRVRVNFNNSICVFFALLFRNHGMVGLVAWMILGPCIGPSGKNRFQSCILAQDRHRCSASVALLDMNGLGKTQFKRLPLSFRNSMVLQWGGVLLTQDPFAGLQLNYLGWCCKKKGKNCKGIKF